MIGELGNQGSAKDESTAVKAVKNVIRDHPFLAGLAPEHLQLLEDHAMRMHYYPGEIIFRVGDPANRFYLIEQGKIALETSERDKPTVLIQTIGAGDVLGWSWLFPPYYWHFDARTIEPTTAIFFYGTRLREQCETDPRLGYELLKRMSSVIIQRLQAARQQLVENAVRSALEG